MAELLPLFPLRLVAFPQVPLELHIFEERYKLLANECIAQDSEFGIALVQKEGIVNAGCAVRVTTVVTRYPDGRFDLIVTGTRRFELLELHHEKPYLQGTVEFFEDDHDDLVPTSLRVQALQMFQRLVQTGQIGDKPLPDVNDPLLSFHIAADVNNFEFQSIILRDRSEGSRLRQIVQFLEQHIPNMQQASRMKQLAPKNGFSSLPAGA